MRLTPLVQLLLPFLPSASIEVPPTATKTQSSLHRDYYNNRTRKD